MKIKKFTEKLEIPDRIEVSVSQDTVSVKGEKGEISRSFIDPKIRISAEDRSILFSVDVFTKREKKLIGTFKAHLKNMFRGVTESHEYVLKICSGHFPMNVSINNNEFQVKNYMGEKTPRTLKINEKVDVKLDGDMINLTGIDKELVAQTAASLEQLTRRSRFDRRIFQDGIYIVNKDGKEIK